MPYRIVVRGDSVTWGQGLLEGDLVASRILNPMTETADLRDTIERYCFCDMRELVWAVADLRPMRQAFGSGRTAA